MKTKNTTLMLITVFTMVAVIFQACNNDSGPKELNVESMMVGEADLNAATSPADVPVDANIVITFNSDINASTATASNITLLQDYNNTNIALDISVDGPTLTINPETDLGNGTLYELSLNAGLLNDDDQPLAQTSRTFTTEGTFSPSGMVANWTFEGTADDVVGNYNPSSDGVVDISYDASRNDAAGTAATFNGNTSIIEIPNGDVLTSTEEFTFSFWMKTNSDGHVNENGDPAGHFVIGLAAFFGFQLEVPADFSQLTLPNAVELSDGSKMGAGNMVWNGDGVTGETGGYEAIVVSDQEDVPALIQDEWIHITFIMDGPDKTRSLFVNGELRMKHDFTLLAADNDLQNVVAMGYNGTEPEVYPELAFGFIHSRAGTLWDNETWGGYDNAGANHFKGQIDDVKIYHKALSETEIQLMYDSES